VLRNRRAREVLEQLEGKSHMVPSDVRKSVGMHPEAFRRLVSDLEAFALITIRALPGQRNAATTRSRTFTIRIGIEISRTGSKLLAVTRDVRITVGRHAKSLPETSLVHWVDA
jgi:hypothetical protein